MPCRFGSPHDVLPGAYAFEGVVAAFCAAIPAPASTARLIATTNVFMRALLSVGILSRRPAKAGRYGRTLRSEATAGRCGFAGAAVLTVRRRRDSWKILNTRNPSRIATIAAYVCGL